MSFVLSSNVDPSKVFLTPKSQLTGRWDPSYFRPELVALEKQVRGVTSLRLRDFVERMAGGATPSTKEAETHYTEGQDGIPFIRVQNLSTTGKLNLEDCKLITRSTHEGLLARSKLSGGELLVKITGVGRMAVASVVPDGFEGNINQHIVAIRTKDTRTSETLAAYLNLDLAERLASRRATGGTRPALDYPALLSIPVVFDESIPALIGAAVENFNEKVRQASTLLAGIDDVLLAELGIKLQPEPPNTIESRIFYASFRQATGNRLDPLYHQGGIFDFIREANCQVFKLVNLVSYFETGFAAGRNDQGDKEQGIIQIRPTNISNDRELVFHRNVYIEAAELSQRSADVLQKQEILFNNTNSQEQVGKSAYFDLDGTFFSSNHITRIYTLSEHLDPQYLYYLLNLYQRRKVFFKLCTNWNNQSGVGVDILKNLPIPAAKLSRQKQIVLRLEEIRTEAHKLRQQAAIDLAASQKAIETLILGEGGQS